MMIITTCKLTLVYKIILACLYTNNACCRCAAQAFVNNIQIDILNMNDEFNDTLNDLSIKCSVRDFLFEHGLISKEELDNTYRELWTAMCESTKRYQDYIDKVHTKQVRNTTVITSVISIIVCLILFVCCSIV